MLAVWLIGDSCRRVLASMMSSMSGYLSPTKVTLLQRLLPYRRHWMVVFFQCPTVPSVLNSGGVIGMSSSSVTACLKMKLPGNRSKLSATSTLTSSSRTSCFSRRGEML